MEKSSHIEKVKSSFIIDQKEVCIGIKEKEVPKCHVSGLGC